MKVQPCKIGRPGEDIVGRTVLPWDEKYTEYAHGTPLEKEQRQRDRAWIWKAMKVGLCFRQIPAAIVGSEDEGALFCRH